MAEEADLIVDTAMREVWLAAKPPESAAREEEAVRQLAAFNAGEQHAVYTDNAQIVAVGGGLDGAALGSDGRLACGCNRLPTLFRASSGQIYQLVYMYVVEGDE